MDDGRISPDEINNQSIRYEWEARNVHLVVKSWETGKFPHRLVFSSISALDLVSVERSANEGFVTWKGGVEDANRKSSTPPHTITPLPLAKRAPRPER